MSQADRCYEGGVQDVLGAPDLRIREDIPVEMNPNGGPEDEDTLAK